MNIKAERIEQLIQIANRNLLLIQSHQGDNVTPLGTNTANITNTTISTITTNTTNTTNTITTTSTITTFSTITTSTTPTTTTTTTIITKQQQQLTITINRFKTTR
jgi:hypothetical protein